MITPERLKEMREVVEAATPGSWYVPQGNREQVNAQIPGYYSNWAICKTRIPEPVLGGIETFFSEKNATYIAHFNPQTVSELLDEIDRYREAQERINEDFLLEVITKWKFNWMDVKGTDKADRDNYRRRAFGVDANMQYSLAEMLVKALRGEG